MRFSRAEFIDAASALRKAHDLPSRAIGDNIEFEENVSSARIGDFEAYPGPSQLREAIANYFYGSVQGNLQSHVPSTFQAMNSDALISGVARVQKIVRLERIDKLVEQRSFARSLRETFDALSAAAVPGRRDDSVIAPYIRAMNLYPGARPVFACFKAEVQADLSEPDWLARLIARLGLGHHSLVNGEDGYFALMEYTVGDVLDLEMISPAVAHFSVPSVLDGRESAFFYPAPRATGDGFAADLDPSAGRDIVREILHMRLRYNAGNLERVGSLSGPTPPIDLLQVRDEHLRRVRARTCCSDYGELMSGAAG